MKKAVVLVFGFALLTHSSFADKTGKQNGLGASLGVGGIIGGIQSGDYNFQNFDVNEFQKQLIGIRKEDRDYFISATKKINESFTRYVQEAVYGEKGLKRYSDKSLYSGGTVLISAQDFLSAVNEFTSRKTVLESEIKSLVALGASLPKDVNLSSRKNGNTAQNFGQINFSSIETYFMSEIQKLTQFVSNLGYLIQLGNNLPHQIVPNTGMGLVLDAPEILLSDEAMEKYQNDMIRFKHWEAKDYGTIDDFAVFTRRMAMNFIDTYGTTERYRFTDKKERNKAKDDLIEIFWVRSYLRVLYGMPLGTFYVDYEKRLANFEVLASKTKGIVNSFREEIVWEQDKFVRLEQNYRNILNVVDQRSVGILDGNAPLLHRLNAAMSWVGGNQELNRVLSLAFKILAADFHEEKLLRKPGGLALLKKFYNERYYSNIEDRKLCDKREAAFGGGNDEDAFSDVGGAAEGSLASHFMKVSAKAEKQMLRIEKARQLEAFVANTINASNLKTFNKKDERRRKLHD